MAGSKEWPRFMALVRESPDSEALFSFVARLIDERIGSRLTTATIFDVAGGQLRRVFTQDSAAYAVGGFKPIPQNKWTEKLIGRHEVYVAQSIGEIAEDFFDWQLIQSLGCESICNLPVVVGGETLGAFNLLNVAGHYVPDRVALAGDIMPFATLAMLTALREPA